MTGAEHERASAVADEAVRLVSALAGMAPGGGGRDSGGADRMGDRNGPEPDAEQHERAESEPCTCRTSSVQAVCEVCPICRVAAFLAEVRPETVERVADVLSMVVGSLETFAAQRRSEMAGSEQDTDRSAEEPTPAPQAAEWQSVQVEDDNEDEDENA